MTRALLLLALAGCGGLAWDGDPAKCDFVARGACFVHKDGFHYGYTQAEAERVLDLTAEYWHVPPTFLTGWLVTVQKGDVKCYSFTASGCCWALRGEIVIEGTLCCPFDFLPHEAGHVVHGGDLFHNGGGYGGADDLSGRCAIRSLSP